jgi:hypothetical protein
MAVDLKGAGLTADLRGWARIESKLPEFAEIKTERHH